MDCVGRYANKGVAPHAAFHDADGLRLRHNSAYQFGGQDFSGALTSEWRFNPTWRLVTTASGGFLVLGAIDSLYVVGSDRQYDSARAQIRRGMALTRRGTRSCAPTTAPCAAYVDGAQRTTGRRTSASTSSCRSRTGRGRKTGEFIRRKSYYDGADDVLQRFPQVRVYLSWMY